MLEAGAERTATLMPCPCMAATNALSHDCDIAKVQEWLRYSNVATTLLYDRRKSTSENSPSDWSRHILLIEEKFY
jgi:hypothetical protein